MSRLLTFLHVVTLLVAAVGVWGFHTMYRPENPAEWGNAALHFTVRAVAHPLVPFLAVAAAAAAFFARRAERAPTVAKKRRRHSVDTRLAEPSTSPVFDLAELRRRLEDLARRKGDLGAFVDVLLDGAVRGGASDVHVQPRDGSTRVSLRRGGQLEDVAVIGETHHAALVRRIKVLSDLVPYKTDTPQDGRLTLESGGGSVDLRISTLPTQHGEKVAIRLVRPAAGLLPLGELGFEPGDEATLKELLREPQGLVILTGPTGSGKTTTIYSALQHVHEDRGGTVQIATIEDPVEMDLGFLSQTTVDRPRGLDFATGLRSLLRQDPNVLMVGEIRDPETAEIAVQAGLSGHLVLTTLHAPSTAGVFTRLIDMRIEPFLAASATLACVAQRLARQLCPECRRPVKLDRATRSRLERHGVEVDGVTFWESFGCRACERGDATGGSGLGRTAIFEVLRLDADLRRRIAAGVTTEEIETEAREAGMKSLAESAFAAAAAGRIGLDEALRITG